MRAPNAEQLPAIEHRGGVILKAGAGSGKTFVLVEHAIYLTRMWRQEWEASTRLHSFEDTLAAKFASTVLMTFTRLAAGEILVRLNQRFDEQLLTVPEEERPWWQVARGQLDRFTVTTIDGFFYKLVGRGFFPELPPDVAIIPERQRREHLIELFDVWWVQRLSSLSENDARDSAMYRAQLTESLLMIFNSPGLREEWMRFSPDDAAPGALDWLLREIVELPGLSAFLRQGEIPLPPPKAKPNKWALLAAELNRMDKTIANWSQLERWAQFAETEVGRTQNRSVDPEAKAHMENWKLFRGAVRSWAASYQAYRENFTERIRPWLVALSDLVRFVSQHLTPSAGLTYGDLEYYVLEAMKRESVVERIFGQFDYFVVDEFQDTSRVQYDILTKMARQRPERFFCVGDAKQAIYGFRGGELQVFRDLEATRGIRPLELRTNYRSTKPVVRFNNALFTYLFPLGPQWCGEDAHAVEMGPQLALEERSAGAVRILSAQLPDLAAEASADEKEPKWTQDQLRKVEARVIAQEIARLLAEGHEGQIAVLYKVLAPSRILMEELMARGIGFTAQAKIPFGDDPIAGVLLALIEDALAKKESRWSRFMLSGYAELLGLPVPERLPELIGLFHKQREVFGIKTAFGLFLASWGISNALYESNLKAIQEIFDLSQDDLEVLATRLQQVASESWSADFRFGAQATKVILQSAHGSKGLEYETVFVAGIATNANSRAGQAWAGSLPGAVLWVRDPKTRTKEATPQFIYEQELAKLKEFAESKRLLYVACTRAQRRLYFVDLEGQGEQLARIKKDTWLMGLRAFLAGGDAALVERRALALSLSEIAGEQGALPFFHQNNLGLGAQSPFPAPAQGITSELAATKLNALLECPRKFYFQQILKLPDSDVRPQKREVTPDEGEERPLSSSQRGSFLHEVLARATQSAHLVLPVEVVNHGDAAKLTWAIGEVASRAQGQRLEAEQPLKFPFFGFMITGIPDLIIWGTPPEIWDYKTGRRSESTELKYWQQLSLYAYALWAQGRVCRSQSIVLRLCYLDAHDIQSREVHWDAVKTELFSFWSRLADLTQAAPAHCPLCPYRGFCPA